MAKKVATPVKKPRFFKTQADFRVWLEKHHASTTELMLGFYNAKSSRKGITYKQALDEALCYGWIDGVRRSVDAERYEQRFTPRTAKSKWSQVNLARVEELKALGVMMPSGLAAWARRDAARDISYSYESRAGTFSPAMQQQFLANPRALAFFESQAPGYRRVATFWVMDAKREETRQARFAKLLGLCVAGRPFGRLEPKPRNSR